MSSGTSGVRLTLMAMSVLPLAGGQRRSFLPTGDGPEQVGESIEVRQDVRAVEGHGEGAALGAADDGAGGVQQGGQAVLAGHDELRRLVEAAGEVVDQG